MGRIADGTTVSDYHVSEKQRQISVSATLLHAEWAGKKFNIIDTPGYLDFISEGLGALRVGDFALVVIHAQHGLGVGTDRAWNYATGYGIPKMIVVNALDKENVDFDAALTSGAGPFRPARVSLVACRSTPVPASTARSTCCAAKSSPTPPTAPANTPRNPPPANGRKKPRRSHRELIEHIAESDDELMNKYFEQGTLVGGGIPRRHPCRGAEGAVHPAVRRLGGKQRRRRAAHGFHRQIRLLARGPEKGPGH